MSTLVEMAKEAGSFSSTSLLSNGTDLLSMLGMSSDSGFSFASNVAAPLSKDDLVICAILDDASSTKVRIGRAVYNKIARAYDMYDGSLQLKESERGADGVFNAKDGLYVVMKQSEFDTLSPPTPARPPSKQKKPEVPKGPSVPPVAKPALAPPAPVGCSMGSDTKTVFVAGNFEGDGKSMSMTLGNMARLAYKAAHHGNRIVYALTGDLAPDVHRTSIHDASIDPLTKANAMAVNGLDLPDGHAVRAEDVMLIAGMRELAWLRIANTDPHSAELAMHGNKNALSVLRRHTPLGSAKGMRRFPALVSHNDSLALFSGKMADSAVAVAMMLKLVSMARTTMNAPGLVFNFLGKLGADKAVDDASLAALSDFLSSFGGSIEEGVIRLIHEGELTPEGLGVFPAATSLVGSVKRYAANTVIPYLKRCKLVGFVHNGALDDSGFWVTPKGSDYGRLRGKLPIGVDTDTLSVKTKQAPSSPHEWTRALNSAFSEFVTHFETGGVDTGFYAALFALSIDTHFNAVPLDGLSNTPTRTCYGITLSESMPFACVQRRILVKDTKERYEQDLVSVLDQWATINTEGYCPSSYWGVCTWCGRTMTDIGYPQLVLSSADTYAIQLHDVSVLLATMLMARVKERTLAEHGIAGLDGVVGPVVVTSSKKTMRSIVFSHEHLDATFVAIVPEAFVQTSLDYYSYDIEAFKGSSAPMIAAEGLVALPDESEVSVGTFLHAENDSATQRSGTRLWKLSKRLLDQSGLTPTTIDQTALHSMSASSRPHTETRILGHTIYHTRQSDVDPFAGLHIGLSKVPSMGARMTIDTDMTPKHKLFRVVARE